MSRGCSSDDFYLTLCENSNIQQFSEYFKELPSLGKPAPVTQGKAVTATSSSAKRENGDEEKTYAYVPDL